MNSAVAPVRLTAVTSPPPPTHSARHGCGRSVLSDGVCALPAAFYVALAKSARIVRAASRIRPPPTKYPPVAIMIASRTPLTDADIHPITSAEAACGGATPPGQRWLKTPVPPR